MYRFAILAVPFSRKDTVLIVARTVEAHEKRGVDHWLPDSKVKRDPPSTLLGTPLISPQDTYILDIFAISTASAPAQAMPN